MSNENKDLVKTSDVEFANKHIRDAARIIRQHILEQATPKEWIRLKPIGSRSVSYVPASFMDNKFKEAVPLYENKFAFQPFVFQNWIIVGVELTDKTTDNVEIGLKAHRIQFNAEKKKAVTGYLDQQKNWHPPTMRIDELTPFDIVDMGNDVSACATEAIKNAQSRFGVCADVYNKIILSEQDLQDMEKEFQEILSEITHPIEQTKIKVNWKEMTPQQKLTYLQELKENNAEI